MKKTQIDRAIESLEKKLEDLRTKFSAESGALDSAIAALKAQRPKKKTPRSIPIHEAPRDAVAER